ncbi:tail completion protein gp17 [Falsigemmobacter faecalis]|uniref:DUF3168 domain-containing protein n=1 Tax=Falsigemmobacter faecalis TaxID=2488730 RepID=A0A3P3DEC5_9RHOB|nr:DUF3168 domain-containing protein [Falsigemmobacter faecalis]RRH71996.1 DUF3168 domain-containing protein [Falsigemmobacter faecalis]
MDEDLWYLLRSDAAVFLHMKERIFWGRAPQGTAYPYLVLTLVGGGEGADLAGPDGLHEYRVQIDSYAPDRGDARAPSRAIAALLNGYSDDKFRGVFLEGTRETSAEAASGRPCRFSQDFNIFWRA